MCKLKLQFNLIFKLILYLWLIVEFDNRITKIDAALVKPKYMKNENVIEGEPKEKEHPLTTTTPALEVEIPIEHELGEADTTTHSTNLMKKCEPCPYGILCVPQIQCPAHVRMTDYEKPQICDLPSGNFGFCCSTGQNHTAMRKDIARLSRPTNVPVYIVEGARREVRRMMHDIPMMPVQRGHPDHLHGMVFHSTVTEDVRNYALSNSAMEQVLAAQMYTKQEQIPMDDIITDNVDVDYKESALAQHCYATQPCAQPDAPYRSLDGYCNNPLPYRAHWGAAGQSMERLLPPAYEDGIWMARQHSVVDGLPLMAAREISRRLMRDVNRPHPKHNLLLMQFGQYIAHDVSQTETVRLDHGELVQCCLPDATGELPPHMRHYACMPMSVESEDDFYGEYNVRCMNFVRLSLAPSGDCKMRYGKQRSKVTHFIDASPVYGSSVATMRELRSYKNGQLRMFDDFGRELLPLADEKNLCDGEQPGKTCFKSGDGRTNQIISLITVHILLAREHNRIAGTLARINPHYSDELLFQEARRILIGELQHIVYNEFLPSIIGPMQMQRFRLTPQHHGYCNAYNVEVNPAITNEFSGAAFRMGHSTVDGKFRMKPQPQPHNANGNDNANANGADDYADEETISIPDVMFNPSYMRMRTFYDDMLRTLYTQPMQRVDSSITYGLSRYMFRGHHPFGLDLASFNIQRGRDEGLRCYNDYLEVMGHRRIHSFKQYAPEVAERISQVYRHPDDIDLWVGGLLEKSVKDGIVGVTFAEIIADQFSRFKVGDRYFYEHGPRINPGAFTPQQLHEIRKASMARLLCDNSDSLQEVPPAAFVRADIPGNRPVRCDSHQIPVVELEAWRVFN